MLKRKFTWLMILMVWVGMVTSIILYQGQEFITLKPIVSKQVKIFENKDNENGLEDVNLKKINNENMKKNFFIEYRLERDKARSEQINIYREIINNPNTDDITKKEAQNSMLALTEKMEKEFEIEGLIRARAYKDALAYVHDDSVDVIIETKGLKKDDVSIIGDIIVKSTGFNFEDLTIIEKKINSGS